MESGSSQRLCYLASAAVPHAQPAAWAPKKEHLIIWAKSRCAKLPIDGQFQVCAWFARRSIQANNSVARLRPLEHDVLAFRRHGEIIHVSSLNLPQLRSTRDVPASRRQEVCGHEPFAVRRETHVSEFSLLRGEHALFLAIHVPEMNLIIRAC